MSSHQQPRQYIYAKYERRSQKLFWEMAVLFWKMAVFVENGFFVLGNNWAIDCNSLIWQLAQSWRWLLNTLYQAHSTVVQTPRTLRRVVLVFWKATRREMTKVSYPVIHCTNWVDQNLRYACFREGLTYLVRPWEVAHIENWIVSKVSSQYPEGTSFCQHTATHCNTMQHSATHYNTPCVLSHIATHCDALQHAATHCNVLQRTATHCNALQRTATRCNTLQHVATHCNTMQRHMRDVTQSRAVYQTSQRVTRRSHMCDMTQSYVWYDSFVCVAWLSHMCGIKFICMTCLKHMCD